MMKSFFDFLIAFFLLVVVSPIFLLICLLQMAHKYPIFFTQKRPGKNEKIFTLWKFKTMTDQKDALGQLLPDDQRLRSWGLFLRKTSLDEIPQLFNILKGDMSFVGPRPLLVQYLPLYNDHQKKRHTVKPGITGWAQVNGRNAITWEQKFDFDVWYVDHQSFLLDLKILFLTAYKVINREGISSEKTATMPAFTGNEGTH